MRVQLRRSHDERGAVAILMAIFATVLIGIAAFTTDFGMAYAQRQALSTGVDSAALAIVHQAYKSELASPVSCAGYLTADAALSSSSPTKASNIAVAQLNANAPFGATLPASAVSTTLTCVGTNSGTLKATVSVNRSINTAFGRVLNISTMQVNRTAAAVLGVQNQVTGLRPIGLCKYQADKIIADAALDEAAAHPYRAELIGLTKVWSGNQSCSGSGGAGNWGWMTFPGQGNGDSALGAMIASGYSGQITIVPTDPASTTIDGTPGNKGNGNPVHDGMQTIMDKIITLPVYNTYSGNGANATYTVIGFLSVKMCGYDVSIKGACYDSTVPMSGDDMQVRYVDYTPAGKIDGSVGIGTSVYDYSTELVQ